MKTYTSAEEYLFKVDERSSKVLISLSVSSKVKISTGKHKTFEWDT